MTTQQDERAELIRVLKDEAQYASHPRAREAMMKAAALLEADANGGEAVAMSDEARAAVKLAYGHLWHVNNEPAAPIAIYDTEKAAYAARRQLRGLLTDQERGDAINHVGLLIGRYETEGKSDAELDIDSNAAKPEQQRELAGSVALGQSVGGSKNKAAGHSQAQGIKHHVATVVGVDEYGPMLEWTTHWVELVGANLYTRPQQAAQVPLTEEQIQFELSKFGWGIDGIGEYTNRKQIAFARAIEKAHGIG